MRRLFQGYSSFLKISQWVRDLFRAHAKHGLFSGKTRQYSEDYHHAGPRVSPGQVEARTPKGVSPNHAENQIRAVAETLQSREGGCRPNWLCPH